MSAFLGKIHYWLFNKIRFAEDIEEKIEKWAFQQGILEAAEWKSEILSKFGPPAGDEPLENIIDTSNIHGWLQDKIIGVESRQAAWITRLLNLNSDYMEAVLEIFKEDGAEKGEKAKEDYNISSTVDVYKVLNDFVLEGMPCDSIDRPLETSDNLYRWISTRCIHRQNWESADGKVEVFYQLRSAWVKSFVRALDEKFEYEVEYDGERRINTITRIRQ